MLVGAVLSDRGRRVHVFKFIGACPEMKGPLIGFITDAWGHGLWRRIPTREITYDVFARHVDLEELRRVGHPAVWRLSTGSYGVSFWKAELPSGKPVYYLDWSSMEHLFVEDPVGFDLDEETRIARERIEEEAERADPWYGRIGSPELPPTWVGESKAPNVDPAMRDMMDREGPVTAETVLRDYVEYGRDYGLVGNYRIRNLGRLDVYFAWVPLDEIPKAELAEVVERELIGTPAEEEEENLAYDWTELESRGTVPAVKLWVRKDGQILIVDGNHRIHFWREAGFVHAGAWVIQERS